ncbi:MAG TPA: hypothetical protein VMT00_11600, partial [Thermoanaerobaculia bacterium]|nr:hypothetical protein [Thermoanaerobaculia bacterium]
MSCLLVVAGLMFSSQTLAGQSRAELKLAEAEILGDAGLIGEALESLAEALRSDPMSLDGARVAEIAQVDAQLFDDSPESQEKVRELRGQARDLLRMWLDRRGPESPVLMAYMAQLRWLEQFDEGFAWLERVLRESPADAALRRELLIHSGAARDVERAVEQAQWFLKSESTASELYLAGAILFELASKGEKDREALARLATELFKASFDRDPEYLDSAIFYSMSLKLQADLTSDRTEAERLRSQSELAMQRAKKIGDERRWLSTMRSWEIDIIQDGE